MSAENGLGSLAECAFSLKMHPFVRSLDISKCYTNVRTIGEFNWVSLNIYFNDVANGQFKEPIVVMRETLSFGNPVSGLIIEIICYAYIDPEIQDQDIKDLISASRYSDNMNAVANSSTELYKVMSILVKAFEKYGLFFKTPVEPFWQIESEDKRKLEDKTANTLGYKWDLKDDTIGSTMEISLVSKIRGESQNRELEEAN